MTSPYLDTPLRPLDTVLSQLRTSNADLLAALHFVRDRLTMLTADHKLGKDKHMIAAQQRIRTAIAKAHTKED